MELKQRKRINNALPGFESGVTPEDNQSTGGGLAGVLPWISMAQFAAGGVAEGINSIQRASDLRADAGTSYGTINGISYQKENEINQSQAIRDYDKNMGMSFLTNPFKGLTMLFGRGKQRRNIQQARMQQDAINRTNRAGASTDYLEQQYSEKYGSPQDYILYAKNGKDSVQTSEGELNLTPNSKTEGGEIVYNAEKQTAHVVPGKAKGDNHLSSILPSDTIITNKYGLADKAKTAAIALQSVNKNKKNRGSLAKQTDDLIRNQATAVLNSVAEEQRQMRNIGILPRTKMNKFGIGKDGFWHWDDEPAYPAEPFRPIDLQPSTKPIPYSEQKGPLAPEVYDGIPYDGSKYASKPPKDERDRRRRFPSNWWIDGLGALTSTGQLIADALQKRKTSNTYFPNPYARNSLSGLMGLRINQFPILKSIYDKERQNKYGINRAGGLSGAQKNYANIATGIATQNAVASALADIQKQNNEYRSSALHAALNAGQADRQARMAANQWDLDYYSKSHAAKHGMVQQDLYNILAALQQGYKNSFKRYTFDNTMDLYTT